MMNKQLQTVKMKAGFGYQLDRAQEMYLSDRRHVLP
jgi:hypothetical protein